MKPADATAPRVAAGALLLLPLLFCSPAAHALTAQAISKFSPASPISYAAGAKFHLSATGGASGNPVTFASSTASVCTVSSSTVSVKSAGTCRLSANQAGNSRYQAAPTVSASVVIDKGVQTIGFTAPERKAFGEGPFRLQATASSRLAVTFTSTTAAVCSVAGSTVTLMGAGTCSIAADQAGNGNYRPAPQVVRSFTVGISQQTINFARLADKTYGALPFTVSASASSGLPVSLAATTPTVCALAGARVTILSGGKCTIAANQAGNANYRAATRVTRSFTVDRASQTISFAAPATQPLAAATFMPSATASSGLVVSFKSSTPPVCTVAGATVTLVKTGTCTLIAKQGGNTNYDEAHEVSRSFAITSALIPQLITGFAPAKPLAYRIGLSFALNAKGGASGNALLFASATTSICTVTAATVKVLAAGTCTLTANQAGNASYSAAPQVAANVAITKGSQTLNFDAPANQRLGAAPFAVSASASSGLAVSFATRTPAVCTVAGSMVAVAALGTCTLAASQPGNANFNAAPSVTQSFLVGQAAITMAVGSAHACALTHAGGVQCWGANAYGQLGDGSTTNRSLPVDVGGLGAGPGSGVVAIAAGSAHSCAITATGGVRCWGNNDAGQLGDGSLNPSSTPRDVAGLTSNVIALTAGSQHTCALLGGGAVRCWGRNADGQLGDGSGLSRLTPVAVTGLSAADVRAGDNHTCAVTRAGATLCWGRNADGQLGDGSVNPAFSPVGVSGLGSGMMLVEGAARHSCALSGTGGVKCWGNNGSGQLGNGGTAASLAPVDVLGLGSGITALAAGDVASCAVTPGGIAQCWGAGKSAPQAIAGLAGSIIELGIGTGYDCALTRNGAMLCWGANGSGQLGDGSTTARLAPAYVSLLSGGSAANQSIAFAALPDRIPSDPPFALDASASSGLAVVFTSITPAVCTVAGNTVTLIAQGICTIAANQAGNSSVNAAQQLTRSFAVAPGTQAISGFSPATPLTYSASLVVVLSATGGASGNPVLFASTTPGVCTVAGSLMSALSASTCMLTASQAGNANYSAAPTVSATVVINPASQTISFAALPSRRVSEAVFGVSASASSGLAVSISSTTPSVCNVADSNVTLVATGTCTLAADQPGNGGITAAPQVTQSFAVTQGSQAITDFAPPSPITYAPNLSFALTATGGASSNEVVFSTLTPAICTVANGTVSIRSAGLCTLSANQAGDANYSAAPQVTASVVIAQTVQSIVFDELPDRTLGDPPFVLTASSSSGLAVAFNSSTTLVCTLAVGTVRLVAPGTCSIEASQAGNANISAALPVTQSFSVDPAAQTITFAALPDRNLGDPPVALSATASSGLAVSFTSATAAVCSITDVTLTLIAPGTCTIAADQAGDSHYGAAPQITQSFTVKPAEAQVYFIHSDHLNTPRLVTDAGNNSVWRWDNVDPFGGNMPDENPGGLGKFTNNLRFPGQYFDRETNLHYNYFRDYDPGMGRYFESDPIGLRGGINTYLYVEGNPIVRFDPRGLRKVIVAIWTSRLSGYFFGSGSVGHVFLGELNGSTLLSQFPSPHGIEGQNTRLSWEKTLEKEGRSPSYIYEVNVPNDPAFDEMVSNLTMVPTWYFWPVGTSFTQCASAAASALRAGGVQGLSATNPVLPNHINTSLWLKSIFGSDVTALTSVPW